MTLGLSLFIVVLCVYLSLSLSLFYHSSSIFVVRYPNRDEVQCTNIWMWSRHLKRNRPWYKRHQIETDRVFSPQVLSVCVNNHYKWMPSDSHINCHLMFISFFGLKYLALIFFFLIFVPFQFQILHFGVCVISCNILKGSSLIPQQIFNHIQKT